MLANWDVVELDFQEVYGIDLSEPGLLRARSWRWLRQRVAGLVSDTSLNGSRLQRVLHPPKLPKSGEDAAQP